MKRILLDQGVPATASTILRERGWDAVHVREIEMNEAADEEILAYAASETRVVITFDRDSPGFSCLPRRFALRLFSSVANDCEPASRSIRVHRR